MSNQNPEALQLPDQLLVRYFRNGEVDFVTRVIADDRGSVEVQLLLLNGSERTDLWRDLGGGLGFVPDARAV